MAKRKKQASEKPADASLTPTARDLCHLTQYLHWALMGLHCATDKDCNQVILTIDIDRRYCTTEYKSDKGRSFCGSPLKPKSLVNLHEATSHPPGVPAAYCQLES